MYKYNEIVTALKTDIQEMSSSAKMPSRQELCARFQCTRTTVDRAINDLIEQGYLYARQGSGTYVAETETNKSDITKVWSLIVPDVVYSLYSAMLRGVSDIAYKNGIAVQIFNNDNDVKKQNEIIRKLIKQHTNGFIIVPAVATEPQYEIFHFLQAQKIPFVFCNRGVEGVTGIPLIRSNNFYGGYMAANYLLQNGYKQPAYISHLYSRTHIERMEGYIAAISEHAIELRREYIIHRCEQNIQNGSKEPYGYMEMKTLLKLPEPPDSVFCSSEYTLEGVYKAVRDAGLEISTDIGVISHDNSTICLHQTPLVTAINLDGYEIGHKAACILQKMMSEDEAPEFNLYVLHPELVERQSCLGPRKNS